MFKNVRAVIQLTIIVDSLIRELNVIRRRVLTNNFEISRGLQFML